MLNAKNDKNNYYSMEKKETLTIFYSLEYLL